MSVWRLRDMKSAAYWYRKGTNNLQVLSPNPIRVALKSKKHLWVPLFIAGLGFEPRTSGL